jgi:hypothetical protein
MQLKYILNLEDYLVFYKRYLKDKSFLFKDYVFGIAILIAFLIRFYNGPTVIRTYVNNTLSKASNLNIFADLIFNFLFIVAIIMVIRFITVNRIKRTIINNPSMMGERELKLFDDKLEVLTSCSKSEYHLSAIRKITKYKIHYFLYIDSQIAIIIPGKTLGSDEFVKQISKRLNINVC